MKRFKVTAEEPGLSNVKHTVSEHDTPQEARTARDERIANQFITDDVLERQVTYRAEKS